MVWGVTSRSDFLPVRGMVADVSFEVPGAQEPQELHPPPVHMSTLPRPSPDGAGAAGTSPTPNPQIHRSRQCLFVKFVREETSGRPWPLLTKSGSKNARTKLPLSSSGASDTVL